MDAEKHDGMDSANKALMELKLENTPTTMVTERSNVNPAAPGKKSNMETETIEQLRMRWVPILRTS